MRLGDWMTETAVPGYTAQDCNLTLAEALDEFYQHNPDAIRQTGDGVRDAFFRSHDTVHVVFGCDTTIHDEVLADMWTIFGSDLGFHSYLDYLDPLKDDLQNIIDDIGYSRFFWQSVNAIPDALRVIYRAWRMRQKWRWRDHRDFVNLPLSQLRDQLNIRVIG